MYQFSGSSRVSTIEALPCEHFFTELTPSPSKPRANRSFRSVVFFFFVCFSNVFHGDPSDTITITITICLFVPLQERTNFLFRCREPRRQYGNSVFRLNLRDTRNLEEIKNSITRRATRPSVPRSA